MDTIDDRELETVCGGFLEMLLPMIPSLISGISGMMNKGKNQDAAAARSQAADPSATVAADPSALHPAAARQVAAATSPGMAPTGCRHVSVTVGSF